MHVTFRTIGNKLYELDLEPTDTVSHVKATLAKEFGFQSNKIKLIYKAKVLLDNNTLQASGVDGTSFIVLYAMQPQQQQETKKENEADVINNNNDGDKNTQSLNGDRQSSVVSAPTINHEIPAASQETRPTLPSTAPLPEIFSNNDMPDPPGFRRKVNELMDMGFSEADCENALRAAVGNVDRAADFLLSGNIPDVPRMLSVRDVPMMNRNTNFERIILSDDENDEIFDDDVDNEEEDGMQNFISFRDEMIQHPDKLRSFLNQMAEDNPAIAGLIRDDPAAFLASIGLNPDDFDLTGLGRSTEYERLMAEFDDKQQASIHNLEKLGFDTMTIIQVYVACDKDEELTKSCLESMM